MIHFHHHEAMPAEFRIWFLLIIGIILVCHGLNRRRHE